MSGSEHKIRNAKVISGIEVPDALWRYEEYGRGRKYSENQAEHIPQNTWAAFDRFVDDFIAFVAEKGKAPPGEFRAYGYRPPGHRLADLKLRWRALRLALGLPRRGSSPARQQRLGLNRDARLRFRRSEGERPAAPAKQLTAADEAPPP